MKAGKVSLDLCNPIAMPRQILKLKEESPLKGKGPERVSTRQKKIVSLSSSLLLHELFFFISILNTILFLFIDAGKLLDGHYLLESEFTNSK